MKPQNSPTLSEGKRMKERKTWTNEHRDAQQSTAAKIGNVNVPHPLACVNYIKDAFVLRNNSLENTTVS